VGGEVDVAQHRLVTERFIQACSIGDVSALVPLLDPDIWGDADLGRLDRRTGATSHGSTKVSRTLLRWFGPATTLVCNPISDHSEVLAFVERRLYAVIQLTVEDEPVKRIHVIADPQKLGGHRLEVPRLRAGPRDERAGDGPAGRRIGILVGDTGLEPVTSSV
jgi:RNA polymerase sigma-70 factor, ECF subfamily